MGVVPPLHFSHIHHRSGVCSHRAVFQRKLDTQVDGIQPTDNRPERGDTINRDTLEYYNKLNHSLDTDPETMERIVRERYHMQRENEDVYIVE